jgi:RNA polymerase sigma factor (sigma-70 family)
LKAGSKETDAFLIERVKQGDTMAFRQLVEKYKDVSLTLACSVLKDKAKAEDVLQDAFMKVFHKAHNFKHQSAFSSWLYRIVINTCYNQLKQAKWHLEPDEGISNESYEKTPFQNLEEEDQKRYVVLALNMLKPHEALVLRLFYLCELSLREIGEITDFSPSKIKVDLHRGRKNMEMALRKLLGNQINDLL